MADILLLPFGSAGDVFPFIWLGRQLKARGHRVTLITGQFFEGHTRAAGLEFIPVGEKDEIGAMVRDPRFWSPGQGGNIYFDTVASTLEPFLDAVESCVGAELLLASAAMFAARLAREKLGIPLITVHLHPVLCPSAHETPLMFPGQRWLCHLPVWMKKALFSLPHPIELMLLRKMRHLCKKHGVKPPRRLWRVWWDSPDGVLLTFPEWFYATQPDWPENLLQWTFPLEDLAAEQPLENGLQAFLAAGDPPVVFSPGSSNVNAARFFEVAAQAVANTGCRAIFITIDPHQIPTNLPPLIHIVRYAPFGVLLRHASVFVHHGGIGSTSLAFAAGVPQLIMHITHDQPDNANRVERLGAGIGLSPRQFTPERVTSELKRLLSVDSFKAAARRCAEKISSNTDTEPLLSWIEQRLRSSRQHTSNSQRTD
ncbi:MAG: glycosyltransferase family 1 protein [Verrucomicrobiaceae bacterium]|nr:glycosyltransferase family 1 protein [Verrucomicrobiaceae bacterium]